MDAWRLIYSSPGSASANMAVDEDLLRQAAAGEAMPSLRFYTWDPPAVSVGRFQDIKKSVNIEACRKHGIDVVRRITGGRAVLHYQELTYSIVSRTDNPLFPNNVLGAYKAIAAGLIRGLKNLGIHAEMVPRSSRNNSLVKKIYKDPSCFSSPSLYEILVNGKKIIGSAQRRIPGAFMQHGSVLLGYDPLLEAELMPASCAVNSITWLWKELGCDTPLNEVKEAFQDGFARSFGITFDPHPNYLSD